MSATERTHTLRDGRRLSAVFDSETEQWVVTLGGKRSRIARARVIGDALKELLDPEQEDLYASSTWFWEAADALSGHDTPLGRRFACPCCGYLTLVKGGGMNLICEVCFWEDDGIQLRDPDDDGSANKVSLRQARRNFLEFEVSELRCLPFVRSPLPDERP